MKKNFRNIWKLCFKVLTFAPAFREEADAESASLIEAALRTSSSSFISLSQRETTRKRKKKKNFRNYLEDILKSSYLCIRFLKRTAIVKRAIFEQIYINNTSSTRAGASQINNWKLMIKARRTWVKQKNRQYLFYID